ncbi:hypothetical protein GCM10009836_74010 [Pseudonocardia ailaonensis]|uniref:OmpA-like domain-containing protein n=2 Tax=Pseudonocardia ailaonensis TaxID=367279 RepID=A0ABN2NU50_9PSEU
MAVGRRGAWWVAAAVVVPVALAAGAVLWLRPAPAVPTSDAAPPVATTAVTPEPGAPAPARLTAPTAATATPDPAGAAAARQKLVERVAAAPLRFAGESAALTAGTAAAVTEIGALLVAAPEVRVHLVGHTADLPGPEGRALALSQDRARAVAEALIAAGVDSGRVTSEGVGDAGPLATPEASRRVEIVLT